MSRPSRARLREPGGASRSSSPARERGGELRWPILGLLVLAAISGVVVQSVRDDRPAAAPPVNAARLTPTASPAGSLGSTWYCAAGTATGKKEGDAEQTLQIVNAADREVTAKVTVVPSEGAPAIREVAVAARGRADLVVSSMVTAPFAAAVVEVPGGRVAVSHLLEGPTGKAMASCSSAPSSSWFIPVGTSIAGTRQLLALFNPFPSDAVVGVSFETDAGTRNPQNFDGVVVPGGRVAVLDISAVVALRNQISTTVTVRSGRVVVDQLQIATATADAPASLAVTAGAPRSSPVWWFADGPTGAGVSAKVTVQNPSDRPARVQLQVRLDQADVNGSVPPFDMSIPAHRYAEVDLSGTGRVPQGIGYTAAAVSLDGVPIVAERSVKALAPASPTGLTITLGSPVLATDWLVPVSAGPSISGTTVIVTNPSSTQTVTISASTIGAGTATPVPGGSGVQILPGGRAGLKIPAGPPSAVEIVADRPVVVEAGTSFTDGGMAEVLAIPVAGALSVVTQGIPPAPPGRAVPAVGDTTPGTVQPTGTGQAPGTSAGR